MRSEKEMYDLLISTAREDSRIHAVYMNGSRTNANADRDIFQDYDIVYVVDETKPFYEDPHWIDRFGERLYMQRPEAMDAAMGRDCDLDACYGWLIQLADGSRLDLHVETMAHCAILEDKLCRILLDKDGSLPAIPESTDAEHWVRRPSEAEYAAVCNEFWWCLNNVAKGLWRKEIPYVQDMLNIFIRPQLIKLLSWEVGTLTDFGVSIGKSGKYMYRWLPADIWNRFLGTYCGSDIQEIWQSVLRMCGLFEETAIGISQKCGFPYQAEEAANSRNFLLHVKALPQDADGVF